MNDEKKTNDTVEEAEGIQTLNLDELDQISGGGGFGGVPRVKIHDYDDSVRKRV